MDVPSIEGTSVKVEVKEKEKETHPATPHGDDLINKKRLNFNYYVESSVKRAQEQNHQNQLSKLRQELNYIKQTEWQYEPIEKYIGQS